MQRERLWYPPGSFEFVHHWAIEVLRLDGEWRTYTEHASQAAAEAQLRRMQERYPTITSARVAEREIAANGFTYL